MINRVLMRVGLLSISLGVIFNEWVIAEIFSPDGGIESFSLRSTIWFLDIFAILFGLFIITYPEQSKAPLLLMSSFVLSLFSLFIFLELFPPVIRYLQLHTIRYYAMKERYIPDDHLVFRTRPFYHLAFPAYKGDLYDPAYGVDVEPINYMASFDQNGFRSSGERGYSDVIVLGDSYMEFGIDESDTFSERLARISGLNTMNLGVGGYGPFQYVSALKRYGIQERPKYALFSFFEGNDVRDVAEYVNWKAGGQYIDHRFSLLSTDFRPKPLVERVVTAVQDILHFTGRAITRAYAQRPSVQSHLPPKVHPTIVALNVGGKQIKTIFHYKNEPRSPEDLFHTDESTQLRKILLEFKTICLENNIVPILLFIPAKAHIYADYSSKNSGERWREIMVQQIAAKQNVEAATVRLADDVDLTFITLTPLFDRAAKEGKFLYYPFDTHWNTEARELAASFVSQQLKLVEKTPYL